MKKSIIEFRDKTEINKKIRYGLEEPSRKRSVLARIVFRGKVVLPTTTRESARSKRGSDRLARKIAITTRMACRQGGESPRCESASD